MKKLMYQVVTIIVTAIIFLNCKNIQTRLNTNNESSNAESYKKGEFIVIMPENSDSIEVKKYYIDKKGVVISISKYDERLQLWFFKPDGTDAIPQPPPKPKPVIPPLRNYYVRNELNKRITLFEAYQPSFRR